MYQFKEGTRGRAPRGTKKVSSQPHPDYDHMWKDVITELFEELLLFFSPDLYEYVDFTTPSRFPRTGTP